MLWLGANVMLEYTTDEAHTLLSSNLQNCQIALDKLSEDLLFLKEQVR
jgi:hypothetical protein